MSDDEADPELVELLRQTLSNANAPAAVTQDTHVLRDAEYIYTHSTDVAIDMRGTVKAAQSIWEQMQARSYDTRKWAEHELHPKTKDEATLHFCFTVDLLNFSFWSELPDEERFAVSYKDRRWTGYNSLVAAINRALDEGIPITTPSFWSDPIGLDEDKMSHIFRSMTDEKMPLLADRLSILREAGHILQEDFDGSIVQFIAAAKHSVVSLVNLLVQHFPSFRDVADFHDQRVRLYKRASILAADIWAAFNGESYGKFDDIDKLTMFAGMILPVVSLVLYADPQDYRVPQMLHSLGCLSYSPPLDSHVRRLQPIESGHQWEVAIRGCSIWSVEAIRRQIVKEHPTAKVNAVLIDFFLYDLAKEREQAGYEAIPHHRTRSIYY